MLILSSSACSPPDCSWHSTLQGFSSKPSQASYNSVPYVMCLSSRFLTQCFTTFLSILAGSQSFSNFLALSLPSDIPSTSQFPTRCHVLHLVTSFLFPLSSHFFLLCFFLSHPFLHLPCLFHHSPLSSPDSDHHGCTFTLSCGVQGVNFILQRTAQEIYSPKTLWQNLM